jgi:hypothetical protein
MRMVACKDNILSEAGARLSDLVVLRVEVITGLERVVVHNTAGRKLKRDEQ